jgi:cytochrome subunit of sulfide dehydrogenase
MKKVRIALLTAAFIGGGLALEAGAQDANLARNLAVTCTHCHGTDGRSVGGTVALAGMPKEQLVQTMKAFKSGARPATVMHQLSKGYTEQQVELIGEYFSQQKLQ